MACWYSGFFLLFHYSFLINFVLGSKTVKFILRDFVGLHCLVICLVVATVDSGFQEFQWFEDSAADLVPIKKKKMLITHKNILIRGFEIDF